MNSEELIKYILEDKDDHFYRILNYRVDSCERYKKFLSSYRDKIRKKIRDKVKEELEDIIIFELEIPFLLLLNDQFDVKYEKYGLRDPGPDYTVTFKQSLEFNMEVKRIREAELGVEFNEWYGTLNSKLSKIRSMLGVMIDILTPEAGRNLMERLQESLEDIFQFIKRNIEELEDRLTHGESRTFLIPGFEEEEISVQIFRWSNKADIKYAGLYGGITPVFITGNELRKFGDTIFEKLGQMKPKMINILSIISDSSTHQRWDLSDCIESINKLLTVSDEEFFSRKGFNDKDDFLEQVKKLSGILFRSTWKGQQEYRNTLWCNNLAEKKVPEEIKTYLKKMDWPKG